MREAEVGDEVLYTLNSWDAQRYNAYMMEMVQKGFPVGYNAHMAGMVVPMKVVRVWGTNYINGLALMDGSLPLWVTSVNLGQGEGTFQFKD